MSAAIKDSCRSLCERLCSPKIRHDHIDILGLYYDSYIQEECAKTIKKYYNGHKYSGIILDDILYIRWNNLQKYFEEFGLETTKRAFSDELALWGLLKLDSDGRRSIHLPGYTNHRERFYGIRIFDLIEKYQEFNEKMWNAYYAGNKK